MFMLAIVVILGVDIGVIMLADSTNDRACRDAARAAAGASDSTTALKRAQTAVLAHAVNSIFLTNPSVDTQNFQYNDFQGNPPPDVSPYVEVATTITVNVPAPIVFGKASFDPGKGKMVLRKAYTFPIVKTQLYLN